jgi:hypothetical protein
VSVLVRAGWPSIAILPGTDRSLSVTERHREGFECSQTKLVCSVCFSFTGFGFGRLSNVECNGRLGDGFCFLVLRSL